MSTITWQPEDPKVWGRVVSADGRFRIVSGGGIVTLHDRNATGTDYPGSVANAQRIAESRVATEAFVASKGVK